MGVILENEETSGVSSILQPYDFSGAGSYGKKPKKASEAFGVFGGFIYCPTLCSDICQCFFVDLVSDLAHFFLYWLYYFANQKVSTTLQAQYYRINIGLFG